MAKTIFIDGEEGTTGLKIRQLLQSRKEIELIRLPKSQRKDEGARHEALNDADVGVLCLPDDAARDSVSRLKDGSTRIIDASTAHRISKGWVYGFPELDSEQALRICGAKRVSNPGCYPTGAISLIRPLIEEKIIPVDYPLTINAISGYSGGGKELINRMEDSTNEDVIRSTWFAYGLSLAHKHVPEIGYYAKLDKVPLFSPSVARFRQGMIVQVPLQLWSLPGRPSVDDIRSALEARYVDATFVSVASKEACEEHVGLLDPEELNNTNDMHLYVFGSKDNQQVILAAQLDNLGKGASGQAVQCLNLMLGLDERAGLV